MYSMTGYGKGSVQSDGREITIELKSVNHRFLDINCKFPRHLSFLEDPVRQDISASLRRGHVDVFIYYQNNREDALTVTLNLPLLHAHQEAYKTIVGTLQLADQPTLQNYLSIPRVIDIQESEDDLQEMLSLAKQALSIALTQLKQMRKTEGNLLCQSFSSLLDDLLYQVKEIE